MFSDQEYNRILWASRRGMLELDLLMVPFVEQRLRGLPEAEQQTFIKLLECEDNDLFAWLLGRGSPDEPELQDIVGKIIRHARQS